MNKETPKVRNPLGMLVMTAIVIACVGYLFWQVLSAYQAGGEGAPSLAVVILGGLLMAAGSGYVISCAIRIFIQDRKEKKAEAEKNPEAQ